jgi:hypothetical protein
MQKDIKTHVKKTDLPECQQGYEGDSGDEEDGDNGEDEGE